MKLRSLAGLAAALVLVPPPAAPAAPVTVSLRIEGPTRTLFEGPVTTDVRTFRFNGDPTEHTCDGTAVNGGTSPVPVPTRGAAVVAAAERTPFAIEGTWFDGLGAGFTRIAGESVAFDPATNRYLVEYENGEAAALGACADDIQPGDDVLFAYGDGTETLLSLRGPAIAPPGGPVTVRVADAGSGAPVAGAAVGGALTAGDGTAVVGPFTTRGDHDLKATKAGAIRSNRLRVCVTDGADGACGTTRPAPPAGGGPAPPALDEAAPLTRIAGIRDGKRYSRRRAPRELRGTVSDDPSGLRAVKLRLTRRVGGRCSFYSGKRERFLRRRCGKRRPFKVGDDTSWRYLLPARLRRGRYVLDAFAIDRAGNRDRIERGRNRVVFRVR